MHESALYKWYIKMASIRSGIGEDKDMYCNGTCKYLNERKHKCELTGEKLSYMKQSGSLSFAVHEHRGICKGDRENGR